jgi:hypothetical protein
MQLRWNCAPGILAAVVFAFLMLPVGTAQAQPAGAQSPPGSGAPAPGAPGPYKAIPITLPEPLKDASFEAFRKELLGIAERKDRAALARMIVRQGFFWER